MQLIFTFSFLEILRSFSLIEIYIRMSEILNFMLFALISQMPPYLLFILVSKSTHPVSLVLSSQNAQCFYISAPLICDSVSWIKMSARHKIADANKIVFHTAGVDKNFKDTKSKV